MGMVFCFGHVIGVLKPGLNCIFPSVQTLCRNPLLPSYIGISYNVLSYIPKEAINVCFGLATDVADGVTVVGGIAVVGGGDAATGGNSVSNS